MWVGGDVYSSDVAGGRHENVPDLAGKSGVKLCGGHATA